MAMKCGTCGASLLGQEGFVRFKCPACTEEEVVRCYRCKKLSVPYKCKKCKFEGP